MDKIKTVKIKNEDGSVSKESYYISADARNIDMTNGYNVQETIGTIDVNNDGNIAEQLNSIDNNIDDIEIDINKKTYYFDTVAAMKADTKLKVGDMAITLGYYEANDGGGAEYKITNIEDINIYQENIGNLYANLIINKILNVKQLGAKGDGVTDDTSIINLAFSKFNNILIKDGIFMIDAEVHLLPKSNNKIELINATLKAIPNNVGTYSIIRFDQVSNIEWNGGIIEGDRDNHLGETGEWGNGISIIQSNNLTIKNCIIKNCWGDGIYLSSGSNINTYNNVVDNVRRNGYSIISVEGFSSNNDKIMNTHGTNPQASIDIEPNTATQKIVNCVINNLYTKNNLGGFGANFYHSDENTEPISIVVNDLYSVDEGGIEVNKDSYTKGFITFNNPVVVNARGPGILLARCYNSDCLVTFNRPQIINCNTLGNAGVKYYSGISMYLESSKDPGDIGNVIIYEPYITNHSNSSVAYIYATNLTENSYVKNLKIINPLNYQEGLALSINKTDGLFFSDKYDNFTSHFNSNMTIQSSNIRSTYYADKFSANRRLTFSDSMPTNLIYKFINNSSNNHHMYLEVLETQSVLGLTNLTNSLIDIPSNGVLFLKKINETDFIILSMVGNIIATPLSSTT